MSPAPLPSRFPAEHRARSFAHRIFTKTPPAILLAAAMLALLFTTAIAAPQRSGGGDSMAKIKFRLDDIRPDGLRGPPDGLVSVAYEFCIPADARFYEKVRRIDPSVEIQPGSRGRIGCSESQTLCIGNTHQPRWRAVLERLASLPEVAEIRECHFE